MPELGVDIDCVTDIAPNPGLASGLRNLGNALARRLITERGSLSYDASYGFNVRGMLNGPFTPLMRSTGAVQISRECEKDDRVLRCDTTISYNFGTQTLIIQLRITTNDSAAPYTFVMSVNALTVDFLEAA